MHELDCSCGCDERDKPEDFFSCDNCGKENLHESHLRFCKWCQSDICDFCNDEHNITCDIKVYSYARLIVDRWRYLWYYKLDDKGISKFCKYSTKNL